MSLSINHPLYGTPSAQEAARMVAEIAAARMPQKAANLWRDFCEAKTLWNATEAYELIVLGHDEEIRVLEWEAEGAEL